MPTAQELGFVEGSDPASPLTNFDKIDVNGEPEFKTSNAGLEYVLIPTTKGNVYTFSKSVIGSIRSTNVKSTGAYIRQALEDKKVLTLFVTHTEANNGSGRENVGLSIYKPTPKRN